jgi:ElaB/YqjD/DUF883 family membrane-anchored ribosome-binding protein
VAYRSRHDTIKIDEGADKMKAKEIMEIGGEAMEFIADHATHESAAMMNVGDFIERTETIMRRYPWIALAMGAGLGYVISRRWRLS